MGDRTGPILDRVTDLFFAVDSDWCLTYLNRSTEWLFEGSRDELVGRVCWDVFPQSIDESVAETLYEARQTESRAVSEWYHDGSDVWFETRAYPTPDGLSVYMIDVTARKRRTNELAQKAAAVEAMDDGVVLLDENYRAVSVNDAVTNTLDVDTDVIVDNHLERLTDLASIPDDHVVRIGRAIDEVSTGIAGRRTLEIPYRSGAGLDRRCEVRIATVDTAAASLALVFRDVTDQHDYEQLVHSLHELTRWLLEATDPEEICAIAVHAGSDLLDLPISGVWLLDDEQGYLDPIAGTAGAHEQFGGLPTFYPGEGLVWDIFESGEPALFDDLQQVSGLYNPDTPLESEIIAPIGTHGVLMTGSLEANRFDETDLQLLSTLTENTSAALDRSDRERTLRDRTERLERQSERLEAVATVLSEDLKEQLTAVGDALDSGGATQSDWEFPFAEDDVAVTLDRTERLVDDIREYARNTTSVGRRAPVDLESAIEDAVEQSRLESAAIVIDDGATLRADPDRFRYLLETVFDDAAARSSGDVTIQIGTVGVETRTDGPRGFYILDDASKNPPTATDGLPDFSIDGDETSDGLGLAVAQAIAEAHDWSVSIGVGENGGTRFEVRDVTTLDPA
ncbi:PAS domain S-box [Halovivax ruber XH-70]|uniref:histidine kinase n=1 Tax=Halovivax ruber (strain DSM 18193 / JCM 13892 / XH-70) TaxID=797302 RepID=L0IAJ6_HALRX|nr:GAF domain-containing protein [Halovivax ruber]AGB15759.1 PAS domain S-box [Halovivax ruber XH-70]